MNNLELYFPILSPSLLAYYVSKGEWKYSRHLQLIESSIFDMLRGNKKHLIVNMPPRHGKSEFISKYFPFWYLINNPNKRIILVSYQAGIAEGWSRKIRDLFVNYGEKFGVRLNPRHNKSNSFGFMEYSGSLYSVGIGGALTGKGADLLIIDDPVKNDEEANSLLFRDKIWEWFNATAMTRLEPDGHCIVVMTRWHEDDLTGRIINHSCIDFNLNWNLISLPAIAQKNDLIGRQEGEALWKERFPINNLLNLKSQIGSYWFSSLYQQEPVPSGNSIFKRENFKYFQEFDTYYNLEISPSLNKKVLKENLTIMATSDLAISTNETSDYTVILIFGKSNDGDILILDIIRERFEFSSHISMLNAIFAKYQPILIGIENVQFQQALIQTAIKSWLPIKSLRADKDKISRALPIASLIENGKVYFKKNSAYLESFEKELLNFPKGKNDDQVDAFAYISQMVTMNSKLLPI
jgi:predicted phage terminase large subunit-like protein